MACGIQVARLECHSALETRDQWGPREVGEEGQTVCELCDTLCLNNLYNNMPVEVDSRTFSVSILFAQNPVPIASFVHLLFKYLQQ